jgi:signal transduction histidine kinase
MEQEVRINAGLEIDKLIRNIAVLTSVMAIIYSTIDYFNRSYFSSLCLGIGGGLVFPFIGYLAKRDHRSLARFLLVVGVNAFIFIAVTTTPFDDGGRFYFVPVSLMIFLLYERYETKSILFGLTLPIVAYFLSFFVQLPSYEVTPEHGMAQDVAKTVNFLGVYIFTLLEVFIFVNYVKHLRIQAIEQSKFSALGIMSSGVAHEINNPLAIIKGRASMLRKHIDQNSKTDIEKDADIIMKTTDRISKIIQGLKVFSRNAESDPFSVVNSKEIIQTSLDLCAERFQRAGIKIEVVDNGHFDLQGREAQMVQVIVNLLSNCYDAVLDLTHKWVKIEVSPNCIRIIDSGQGIPKKTAEKLMQPFFTTKGVGKGTGLGLSISKGIVEKHSGELFLDSTHANTCFVIRFKSGSHVVHSA